MLAITADNASVRWDSKKKNWITSIKMGAEVIHRSPDKPLPPDSSDDALRSWVIQTAKDEGYEIAPARVSIER
jgi:hypothetical protein